MMDDNIEENFINNHKKQIQNKIKWENLMQEQKMLFVPNEHSTVL